MLLHVPSSFMVLDSPFQLIASSTSCHSLLASLVHHCSSGISSLPSDPEKAERIRKGSEKFLRQSFLPVAVVSSTVFFWSVLLSQSLEKP